MSMRVLVRFGVYELDVEAQELLREGRPIRLPPQALRLLTVLTGTPAIVVSRERLRAALWPDETHVDFERSLNSAMRKLRAALHDEAEHPRYIQTLPRRGYRFIAPVHRVERAPDTTFAGHAGGDATPPLSADAADAPTRADVRSTTARPAAPTAWPAWPAWPGASPARNGTPRPLLAALAACLLCASIVSIDTGRSLPHGIPLNVRLASAPSPGSRHEAEAGRLLQMVRARLNRLDPGRLVVTGDSPRGCHEVVVSIPTRAAVAQTALQLLDTCQDVQLWADVVDTASPGGERKMLVGLGRAVVGRLLDGEPAARVTAATVNDRALDAYREASVAGERMTELSHAVEAFSRAVALDADFAPAWAGLARARASRAMLDGRGAPEFHLARQEALRALAGDDSLADAHLALGQALFALDNDPTGAEIALRRAKALGVARGRDQLWLAWVLVDQGRHAEALRVIDGTLAHEPRNALLHGWRGFLLHALHRYEEELVELRYAVSLDDRSWESVLHLGLGYYRRGQYEHALSTIRRAVALSDAGGLCLSWLGRVSADAGDVASAERVLEQLHEIGRTRELSPSLDASVRYHIAARRQRVPTGGGI